MDLLIPNKSDVLKYLDDGSEEPVRKAFVTLFMGAESPPVVKEYAVYPLPEPTTHQLIYDPNHPGPIPWHKRPLDDVFYRGIAKVINRNLEAALKLLNESFGFEEESCEGIECFTFNMGIPGSPISGERKIWYTFLRGIPGAFWFHQLPFQLLINAEGTDPAQYRVEQVLYGNQTFPNVYELVSAHESGNLTLYKLPKQSQKLPFGSTKRRPVRSPASQMPRMSYPNGKRFDVYNQHVDYTDWSLDFRINHLVGLQIFNVKFQNQRVAYEISLQDIVVFYNGLGPKASSIRFFDTSFEISKSLSPLLRGVDCPEEAEFLPITIHSQEKTFQKIKNAICIFELNTGLPIRRHMGMHFNSSESNRASPRDFYVGTMANVLILRTIPRIGNYDYILDYVFHQSGAIEFKVSPTGFVQSFPCVYESSLYGFMLNREHQSCANLHQHLFNVRIDLDIAGRRNRFKTIDIKLENITHPYEPDKRLTQTHMEHKVKMTEKDSLIRYNFDEPKEYIVYNDQVTNSAGNKRGFRIHNSAMTKQLIPTGAHAEPGARWSQYQLLATKHSDFESTASSLYTQMDPFDPQLKFETFYSNDESIVDEDLVLWASMGTQHIPTAEDVPITITSGKTMSLALFPFNYFDEDPGMASVDVVNIYSSVEGESLIVDEMVYGNASDLLCFPQRKPGFF